MNSIETEGDREKIYVMTHKRDGTLVWRCVSTNTMDVNHQETID